jgi:hypothetical protein
MCFCESNRTTNDGMFTTCLRTLFENKSLPYMRSSMAPKRSQTKQPVLLQQSNTCCLPSVKGKFEHDRRRVIHSSGLSILKSTVARVISSVLMRDRFFLTLCVSGGSIYVRGELILQDPGGILGFVGVSRRSPRL